MDNNNNNNKTFINSYNSSSCHQLQQHLISQNTVINADTIELTSQSSLNTILDVLTWDERNCSALMDQMHGSIPEFPYYIRTTATIVCTIVLIMGTTGNLLVPIVVIKTKELRNSTNLFLINLSIADLLVLIVCMPTVLIELHTKPEIWHLGEWMCKAVPFVELVVAHGSILTILAISFERYYAICKPLKAGYKCTIRRAVIIIGVLWSVAFVATIPVLFGTELSQARYVDNSVVSVCLTNANTDWQKIYYFLTMTAFFWLPLCVLLVIYCIITKRLILDDRIDSTSGRITCNAEHIQMRARRQVVLMLAAVVICFFICLLPFRVFTLWMIFTTEDPISQLSMESFYNILYFCRVLLYVNSMLNPCLYAVVSSKFREAFMIVLCCQRKNRQLIRHSTFNTTNSSVVLSSLKNSLNSGTNGGNQCSGVGGGAISATNMNNNGGTNSCATITNATVHQQTSSQETPLMAYTSVRNPLFEPRIDGPTIKQLLDDLADDNIDIRVKYQSIDIDSQSLLKGTPAEESCV